MYAVEFTTNIKDGMIEVPKAYRQQFKGHVKVILLASEAPKDEEDIIAALLAQPLAIPGFAPLSREDAQARCGRQQEV
jgi:hypothetical protein